MSLRRRIGAAAAVAVAAIALLVGAVGYVATRSQLTGQLRSELRQRAAPYLQPHKGDRDDRARQPGGAPQPPAGDEGDGPGGGAVPEGPAFGGAPGYFQSVYPDGKVFAERPGTRLPVDGRVLAIARRGSGSFFSAITLDGQHLEVLAIADRFDHKAVQVALPMASVDSVLHDLLLTYGLLVGLGIAAAGLLGVLIARAALAPIARFSAQTEQATSDLQRPHRLAPGGAIELQRLAASFNSTLDALERSIASQRHLIADASHELRTPLAALRSNIQIFLDAGALPDSERRELQAAILAELDELTGLVSDVLELARGASPSTHTDSIELDSVIRDAVARAQRRAPEMHFELELEPTVITNAPDRVNRAVTNLIDNARKWSPPEGPVEITLRAGQITVRDHGPGIPSGDIDHVFERFYRSQQSRRMPGSGLGLAIVKQAAEAHGGQVSATNAPGGGAIFYISFEPTKPMSSVSLAPSPAGAAGRA